MNLNLISRYLRSTLTVFTVLSSSLTFASGFEKSLFWSGRYAPIAGAASSSVVGAEALYFNPAGLAAPTEKGIELTGNFSPIFAKFSGPLLAANTPVEGDRSLIPSFGLFSSYKLTEKWGFGIGFYAAGGAKAVFKGVNLASASFPNTSTDVKADLAIAELSVGTGYEILDGLRVGAGYRVAFVKASLASAAVVNSGAGLIASTVNLDGLSDTRWNGFRFGIQYAPKDSRWGVGLDWRTQINFIAKSDSFNGTITNAALTGNNPVAFTGGPASAADVFPQQINLGGHFEFVSGQRAFLQYSFTEYHKDKQIDLSGDATVGAVPIALSDNPVIQNWKNLHVIRLGYECAASETWAFRGGYVLTSDVTPKDEARATFFPPGFGHTFALGAGKSLLNNSLELNGAFDYSWASGTVEAADLPASSTVLPGDYDVNAFTFHLGATYRI